MTFIVYFRNRFLTLSMLVLEVLFFAKMLGVVASLLPCRMHTVQTELALCCEFIAMAELPPYIVGGTVLSSVCTDVGRWLERHKGRPLSDLVNTVQFFVDTADPCLAAAVAKQGKDRRRDVRTYTYIYIYIELLS